MNKILLITDTHVGVRNENENFLKASADFFNYVFEYCIENNIKNIIHLGDFFDDRRKVSSKLINWVFDNFVTKLKKYDIHCYMIAGNHDIYYRKQNTPNILKELFFNSLQITVVDEDVLDLNLFGLKLKLVPWLSDSNTDTILNNLQKKSDIVLGHFNFAGFVFQGNTVADGGIDRTIFKSQNLILSGHYHAKSSQDNIMYLGNPYAITWGETSNIHGIHVINIDSKTKEKYNIEFVEINLNLFRKIQYANEIEYSNFSGEKYIRIITDNDTDKYKLQLFKESAIKQGIDNIVILNNLNSSVSTIELKFNLTSSNLLELLEKYVDENYTADSKSIFEKIKTIYHESGE